MITLAATARFFDPGDVPAHGGRASFLLGDPDGTTRVYSCLLDHADGGDLGGGEAVRVRVQVPMLTSFAVPEHPVVLWCGTIVGELSEVTVLPADGSEADQTSAWARPECSSGEQHLVDHVSTASFDR